jgi:hypothetical protein
LVANAGRRFISISFSLILFPPPPARAIGGNSLKHLLFIVGEGRRRRRREGASGEGIKLIKKLKFLL